MKRFFSSAIILLLFFGTSLSAQNQGFTVKIKLVDSKSAEGVEYATVSLSKEGSTDVLKYAQTDGYGAVALTGVKAGKYVIKGILLGYEDYVETIDVSGDLNLGTKKMKVQAEFLEGAKVTDVGNPIVIKKDTIEHNVAMIKTSDNDVLEDLLKKLPGVEVSSDGSITANGKTISKIQIDGKEFFLDDPTLASKNLPAKIIEKVRVVEKKSDQAQFTGIDDGEETTVLDLGIKKGMMNGWMGNFSAGGGYDVRSAAADGLEQDNDFRYQGSGLLANFTDKNHVAVIANANNTNNRGFQDMMASTMGGMRGGGMRGGNNNGISNSYLLGGNGGWDTKGGSEIIGNLMGNANKRYVEESTNRTTMLTDGSSLNEISDSYNTNWTYGVRAGGRADFKVSEKTSFIVEPNFNYGWGKFDENEIFSNTKTLTDGTQYQVNDGSSLSQGNSTSLNGNARVMWRQKFNKTGRTLSLDARYTISRNAIDGWNYSNTNVYDESDYTTTTVDQQYTTKTSSDGINARLAYTEPLWKNTYLEASYRMNYQNRSTVKETFDKDASGNYTVKDQDYSSDVANQITNQTFGLAFKYQKDKINLSIGANGHLNSQTNTRKTGGVDTTLNLNTFNWAPNARIDINFSDTKMLRINYRGRQTDPTMTQLMPVPDNSNPQRQTLGNMSLNPSFRHDLRMMYHGNNTETFSSIHADLDGTLNTSSIVNASWTDAAGVQYTVPMNYDEPTYSASGMMMYNTPIAKSKFSIMSFTRASYSNGVSFTGKEGVEIDPTDKMSYLNMDNYLSNKYQNVSVMENIRLTYRNDYWELTASGGTRYSKAFYEITENNVDATWNSNVGAEVVLSHNILSFKTDAKYNFYSGYSDGYNDPTLVWNFEVSKQLFKNAMTIAVKAYDILDQSKNTSRTTTDNYVLDTRNNTLGRYIMLTLTYRFGTFGKKGEMRGGPMGGPGGPGGPGGGPMGGGPGRM